MKKMTHLPESELEIMQIIWAEPAPVSRLTIEQALEKIHPLAPTTILTLLTRLCEKGFLSLEKEGRTNLYRPLIKQKDYLASEKPLLPGPDVWRIGSRIRYCSVRQRN